MTAAKQSKAKSEAEEKVESPKLQMAKRTERTEKEKMEKRGMEETAWGP